MIIALLIWRPKVNHYAPKLMAETQNVQPTALRDCCSADAELNELSCEGRKEFPELFKDVEIHSATPIHKNKSSLSWYPAVNPDLKAEPLVENLVLQPWSSLKSNAESTALNLNIPVSAPASLA